MHTISISKRVPSTFKIFINSDICIFDISKYLPRFYIFSKGTITPFYLQNSLNHHPPPSKPSPNSRPIEQHNSKASRSSYQLSRRKSSESSNPERRFRSLARQELEKIVHTCSRRFSEGTVSCKSVGQGGSPGLDPARRIRVIRSGTSLSRFFSTAARGRNIFGRWRVR